MMQSMWVKFFIILTLWSGCQKTEPAKSGSERYRDYVKDIERKFAEQMKKELNLVCVGPCGRSDEKVEEIGMEFIAHRRATVEEARALQLFAMKQLVQTINAHEEIQAFLKVRPFTFKQIVIKIAFEGVNGQRYADGSVSDICNVPEEACVENRNKIFYSSKDPFTVNYHNIRAESYEEAIRLNETESPQNLALHQTTAQEEAVDRVLNAFTKEMATRFGLDCWSIGAKMGNGVEEIGATFDIVRRADQEKARDVGVLVAEGLLEAINSDEKLRPFLIEYPFPSSRLRIRVKLRNERGYRYHDGSMESITLDRDEITYFQEPPLDTRPYPIETPIFAKESYQDIKEKLMSEFVLFKTMLYHFY